MPRDAHHVTGTKLANRLCERSIQIVPELGGTRCFQIPKSLSQLRSVIWRNQPGDSCQDFRAHLLLSAVHFQVACFNRLGLFKVYVLRCVDSALEFSPLCAGVRRDNNVSRYWQSDGGRGEGAR